MPAPARDEKHELPVRDGKGLLPAGYRKTVVAVGLLGSGPFSLVLVSRHPFLGEARIPLEADGPQVVVLETPLVLVGPAEVSLEVSGGAVAYAGLLGPLESSTPAVQE